MKEKNNGYPHPGNAPVSGSDRPDSTVTLKPDRAGPAVQALPRHKDTAPSPDQSGKVYYLVIEHIRTLIRTGALTFGGKLPSERQLSVSLGSGRNSIREALRSLENMGIIESRQGQGNFLVNNMGKSLGSIFSLLLFTNECSLPEISQLRRSIEIGAYLIAVRQTDAQDLTSLTRALRRLKDCPPDESAPAEWEFHHTLIELSGNRLLKLLSETLAPLSENSIREVLSHLPGQDREQLLSCHTRICECLAARKEAAGLEAIMAHYDLIDRTLSAKSPDPAR